MRLAFVIPLLWAVPAIADKTTPIGVPRGLGYAWTDATAQRFMTANQVAWRALVDRGLDLWMFPGGEACDVGYGTSPSDSDGAPSAFSASPDGKTLLVVTSAKLDAKLGKQLGIAARDPAKVSTVVIGIDGPSGNLWTVAMADGGGCDRRATVFTWSSDGKRVFASGQMTTSTSGETHGATIDVTAHALRYEGTRAGYLPSPRVQHVASRGQDGELEIDEQTVWGGPGKTYAAPAWSSEASLTFCGVAGKVPALYRLDLAGDGAAKVTRLRACSAPP